MDVQYNTEAHKTSLHQELIQGLINLASKSERAGLRNEAMILIAFAYSILDSREAP